MYQVICLALLMGGVNGYQTGAPPTSCDTMVPGHGTFTPQTTPSPYSLIVNDTSFNSTSYKFNITISSGIAFGGFLLMASSSNKTYIGQFMSMPNVARKAECGPGASNNDTISAVTHISDENKQNLVFEWAPDTNYCGDVFFFLTAARAFQDFWVNITSSTNIPCPTSPTDNYNVATTVQPWTIWIFSLVTIIRYFVH